MSLPFGMSAFSERVDAEIESVVSAATALLSAPAPCAPHSPPAPEALSDSASPAALIERRTQPGRACIARTRERIQATLEWESCDEESGRFRAIAQQFDEAFEKENLDDEEGSEDASDESASGSGSEDDDAYESSFVTDGSGSEYEDDEAEWTPRKRACVPSHSASPLPDAPSKDSPHTEESAELPSVMPDEPSAGFLHMEEFAGLAPAGRDDLAVITELSAARSVAHGELAETASFLHAEELDSPPGFYNLWVL